MQAKNFVDPAFINLLINESKSIIQPSVQNQFMYQQLPSNITNQQTSTLSGWPLPSSNMDSQIQQKIINNRILQKLIFVRKYVCLKLQQEKQIQIQDQQVNEICFQIGGQEMDTIVQNINRIDQILQLRLDEQSVQTQRIISDFLQQNIEQYKRDLQQYQHRYNEILDTINCIAASAIVKNILGQGNIVDRSFNQCLQKLYGDQQYQDAVRLLQSDIFKYLQILLENNSKLYEIDIQQRLFIYQKIFYQTMIILTNIKQYRYQLKCTEEIIKPFVQTIINHQVNPALFINLYQILDEQVLVKIFTEYGRKKEVKQEYIDTIEQCIQDNDSKAQIRLELIRYLNKKDENEGVIINQINLLLFNGRTLLSEQIRQQLINYTIFNLIRRMDNQYDKIIEFLQQDYTQQFIRQELPQQQTQLGLSGYNQNQNTDNNFNNQLGNNILNLEIQILQETIQAINEINQLCIDNQRQHLVSLKNNIESIFYDCQIYQNQSQDQLQAIEQWINQDNKLRKNQNYEIIKILLNIVFRKYVEACYWFNARPGDIQNRVREKVVQFDQQTNLILDVLNK